jgi:hypothetical protein
VAMLTAFHSIIFPQSSSHDFPLPPLRLTHFNLLQSSPLLDVGMQEGYLDDVFDVLDAHCHPCILMGRFALIWMGVEVFSEQVSPQIIIVL